MLPQVGPVTETAVPEKTTGSSIVKTLSLSTELKSVRDL
eukprot:COSAG01_NODE_38804_length_484_cov_138.342857_2_plen_38_part_01